MYKDYHQILGVDKNATPDQIKAAYKKLAKQYHPDVNKDDGAEDMFKSVNEAYTNLTDPNTKKREPNQRSNRNPFNPFRDFPNFNDFKNSNYNSYDYHYNPPIPQKGKDIIANAPLTVKEAFFGCKKKVEYNRSIKCTTCEHNKQVYINCTTCNGQGMVEVTRQNGFVFSSQIVVCHRCKGQGQVLEDPCGVCNDTKVVKKKETIEINIPKFSTLGTRLRVKGFGEVGINNGEPGDFYMVINNILPYDTFFVENGLLQTKIYLNPIEAILGTKKNIKTVLDEEIELEIDPMTKDNEILYVEEQGLVKLPGGSERGMLGVRIEYMYPSELTERQTEILNEFLEIESTK